MERIKLLIIEHWIRIVTTFAVVVAIFFSVAYVCMALKGKAVMVKQLEDLTHRKVSVGFFDLTLPFNLELKNVDIQGLAKIESLHVSPSLLYFLTGKIALNELKFIRPEFTLERFSEAPKAKEAAQPPEAAVLKEPAPAVEAIPAQQTAPQPETAPQVETAAQPATAPQSETVPQVEAAPQPEAAPQAETAPKVEAAPQAETPPKTEAAAPAPSIETSPAAAPAVVKTEPPAPEAEPAPAPAVPECEVGKKHPVRIILKRLTIQDGRLLLIDHTVSTGEIRITIDAINFNLNNFYPSFYRAIANFDLTGRIPWEKGEKAGKIQAEGWLNFCKKDIQATVKIQDIDGVYLYPYYAPWVDLEKARIASAKLNYSASIHGLNDDVTIDHHIELTDIESMPSSSEASDQKAEKIRDFVLGLFKALNNGKVELNFTTRTKMSNPRFAFGSIRAAVEDTFTEVRAKRGGSVTQEVISLPGTLLTVPIKTLAGLSTALIDGTFAVGKHLKKAFGGPKAKEPQVQQK